MEKRQFLTSTVGLLAGAASNSIGYAANNVKAETQTILTITGDIDRTNRNKFDPVRDQLMHKQGIQFNKAYAFPLEDLEKLRVKTIKPTLEYDARVHQLNGPRLVDVLTQVGIKNRTPKTKILMHGIDGYSPEMSWSQAQEYDFILATRMDDQLLSIGGLGPLFAIYDADRIKEFAQKPLNQRFALCPWGLYCIEIKL